MLIDLECRADILFQPRGRTLFTSLARGHFFGYWDITGYPHNGVQGFQHWDNFMGSSPAGGRWWRRGRANVLHSLAIFSHHGLRRSAQRLFCLLQLSWVQAFAQKEEDGFPGMITLVQLAARFTALHIPCCKGRALFLALKEDGSGKDGGRVIGKLTLAYCLVI